MGTEYKLEGEEGESDIERESFILRVFIAFEILVLFPEDEGLRSSVRSQRFLLQVIDKLLQTLWLDEIMYLSRAVVPVGDIEHEIYLLRGTG